MTITESQRRDLDLLAESAGWRWADVEAWAYDQFREPVAGLSEAQARRLIADIEAWTKREADYEAAV